MSRDRGAILNRGRKQQLIDGSGLRWGAITLTDVDAFFEFRGKAVVFVEYKSGDAPVPDGQLRALNEIVDAATLAGKKAMLIIAEHNQPAHIDIDAANAKVRTVRMNMRTYPRDGHIINPMTVKQCMDRFLIEAGLGKELGITNGEEAA